MGGKSRKVLFVFLVVVVLFAVYLIIPDSNDIEYHSVYQVKSTLHPGEIVQDHHFRRVDVIQKEDWMVSDISLIIGKKTTRLIPANRYVDINDFEDNVPILFEKGQGEYTISARVDQLNGGRIEPGDHVKVIFVERDDGDEIQPGIILPGQYTVVSVRTQWGEDVDNAKSSSNSSTAPAAVTLKVHERDAQTLAAYQEHGFLSVMVVKGDER